MIIDWKFMKAYTRYKSRDNIYEKLIGKIRSNGVNVKIYNLQAS